MYWASLNIFVILFLVGVGLLVLAVGELQVVAVLIHLLLKGQFIVFGSQNENSNTQELRLYLRIPSLLYTVTTAVVLRRFPSTTSLDSQSTAVASVNH